MDNWQLAVMANLASLNEVVTEMAQASADGTRAEPEFAALVRDTLRQHSHALGFRFQDESPPGAEGMQLVGWDRPGRPRKPYRRPYIAPVETGEPSQHGPWDQYAEYVAPVETGEPFRGAAEAEWDSSRGEES